MKTDPPAHRPTHLTVRGRFTLVAVVAFVLATLFGGLSLLSYAGGHTAAHLRLAGVAEIFVAVVMLIAGVGAMASGGSDLWPGRRGSLSDRMWAWAALLAGACMVAAAVAALMSHEFLRAATGAGG